jgi:hypothetical protein
MNIALLSTHSSNCGISEYTSHLIEEYRKLEHNVVVFNNKVTDSRWTGLEYQKIFGVKHWKEEPAIDIPGFLEGWDRATKKFGEIDVLQVEYHVSFYEEVGFNKLLEQTNCKKVITLHDNTTRPGHNFTPFSAAIVHWPKEKSNIKNVPHYELPFPTVKSYPSVFSFGLGRNDIDLIERCCEKIGFEFDYHDPKYQGWIEEYELFKKMSAADVIVLWYNEVACIGGSSALKMAISSCRPVIVNNVNWFKNSPNFVHKVNTEEELCNKLLEITHYDYIKENSFEELAKKQIKIYKGEKCE